MNKIPENIPQHIAIIMDGNGRWAQERHLPRTIGHREGIKRVKEIVAAACELGIKVITLFAFSTENWSRPPKEINMLMRSLSIFLDREVKEMVKKSIRFRMIGRIDPFPDYLQAKIRNAEEATKNNSRLILVLALNYGARQEMVDAVKKFSRSVVEGRADPDTLDPEQFAGYFYTAGLPDPDLLIRTSGEMRLSNFLLWQLSYAELYFPKKYWPDFRRDDFEKAIKMYQSRERRFGGISNADK
jgi:undecaprenyl diphosphate synthase